VLKKLFQLSIITVAISGCAQTPNIDKAYWGAWESSGDGYLINLTQKGLEAYDISRRHCLKQQVDPKVRGEQFSHFEIFNEDKIGISQSENSKIYHFKRIGQIPARCLEAVTNSPVQVFQHFVDLMSEHYAYFDLYGVDWSARRAEAASLIHENTTDKELAQVFADLLQGINDDHLFVNATVNGKSQKISNSDSRVLTPALDKAFDQQSKIKDRKEFGLKWYQTTIEKITTDLIPEAKSAANDQIIWGEIDNIGYVKIRNMHSLTDDGILAEEIRAINNAFRRVVTDLASSSHIILDLTTNSGGSDEIGREITNYFTNQKVIMYSHQTLGSNESPQTYFTKPNDNAYLGPVYVYTSDHTVSAAETFVMAMKSLPNVIHVGATTRGAFSDILDKTLPNGWEVGLSNMFYWDKDGISWEGKGLTPDQVFPVFSRGKISNSHLEATEHLIRLVNK
jgi:carboxyl-terminal processing protease